MPAIEKPSKESPGSKELREIQERVKIRKEKERARKKEEALEEEEEAKKAKEQKALGLANPKQNSINEASKKTSKDPKKEFEASTSTKWFSSSGAVV